MTGTGAVVVSHRTPVRAARCAASLLAAGADPVLVVDSGSGDDTAARVRAVGAEVLELPNLGFGRAVNAGVAALPAGVDVVVVCNADTVWDRGSADRLAAAVRQPGVSAAGPRVTYPDGRRQASARSLPDLPTALGHAAFGLWWPDNPWTRRYRAVGATDQPREVDWLSGCALAVDRAAFTAIGGFDPAYFLYAEDVDLGVRLRGAGGRLVTVPDARVVHEVGASTRGMPRRVQQHARSLDRFAATHVLVGRRALLRPVVRLGLAAWAVGAAVWGRTRGAAAGRSTTGE